MIWPNWRMWNPWPEMSRMQRELNRLFEGFEPTAQRPQGPPLNIWQGSDNCAVTIELPGVEAKDIEVSVLDDQMTIRGARTAESPGEEYTAVRRERGDGEFVRTVQLPFRADPNKVEAEVRKGVLCVKAPRLEADKPKRIAVKT